MVAQDKLMMQMNLGRPTAITKVICPLEDHNLLVQSVVVPERQA